ncbi:MAG TPA: hypothetical protein PKV17_13740 [Aquabacterium sp.]|nr:hypothetical protein [Aquabacterium sp.]HRH29837.1 hypothetical protein [Aquabacterium sp.]
MNSTTLKTAGRASIEQLQTLAEQGVSRALSARMTELSAADTQAVSGGAVLSSAVLRKPLINGILNPEIMKSLQQQFTVPQVNTQGILIGL